MSRPALSQARRRIHAIRPGTLLMAAMLSCFALGLAFIPAATAKRDTEVSNAAASGQATTQTTTTEANAPSATNAPTESAPATKGKRHENSGRDRQAPAAAGTPSTSAGQETTGSTTPAPARHGGGGHERFAAQRGPHSARSHHRAGATSPSATPGEAQEEPQLEDLVRAASNTAGVPHKSKHHKKEGKGGKEGTKEGKGGKHKGKGGEEPEEKKSEPEDPQSQPSAPSSTPTAVVAAAPPAPSPPQPSSQVSPQPASGLSTPSRIAHRGHHPRTHRAAKTAPVAAVAGLGAAALAPTLPSTHTDAGAPAPRTPPHSTNGGPVAPLVRTITKIVDVVPTPVRALIAGLLALALAFAARSRMAAVRARRLERQRGELLDDVGLLQAALLPVAPERVGAVATSAAYEPAAGPGAGGDFYDVFALPDGRLAVIVGDISGHGRQALPHTALVRFTLRAYLEAGLSPRDALQTAGAVLERQLTGVFATVVVAIYEPSERVLVYSCAGHPPPLVLGADAGAGSLAPVTISASPPIGVGMRTGSRQTTVALPGRAHICFYTDGVTEARVGSELFGSERLAEELAELGPDASAAALLEQVAAHADARPDDMAACLLSLDGGDAAPEVLVEELELDRTEASNTRTMSFLHACGVEQGAAAEAIRSASAAAGRAGTIVLEVRGGQLEPEVALRREQLTHLHARRGEAAARVGAQAAR
jgi:serine phosphatase RsbU (regulator of sigma subunit)